MRNGDPSDLHKMASLLDLRKAPIHASWRRSGDDAVEDRREYDSYSRFWYGDPPEALLCVRLLGVVTQQLQSDGTVFRCILDDSTATMEMRIDRPTCSTDDLPGVGSLVDCLGKLRIETKRPADEPVQGRSRPHGQHSNQAIDSSERRWIEVHGWNIKSDPQEEVVYLLEALQKHKGHYFDKKKKSSAVMTPSEQRLVAENSEVTNHGKRAFDSRPLPPNEANPLDEIPTPLDLSTSHSSYNRRRLQQPKSSACTPSAVHSRRESYSQNNAAKDLQKRRKILTPQTPNNANSGIPSQYDCSTPKLQESENASALQSASNLQFDSSELLCALRKTNSKGGDVPYLMSIFAKFSEAQVRKGLDDLMLEAEIYENEGRYFVM